MPLGRRRIAARSRDNATWASSVINWDDLRYFLAVAEQGGTNAAARALGVDPTTVQRRIGELERRVGQVLVQRGPQGYRLTALGQQLLAAAREVGAAVGRLEQQLASARHDVVGTVRLTCPEPMMRRLTDARIIEDFHALHPDVHIEFVSSDRYLDIANGDADVALRSGDTDDVRLMGRKIGDSLWAVYAAHTYVERHGAPSGDADLAAHALVGLADSMGRHRARVWLERVAPQGHVVVRSDSVLGLLNAVKSGVGVAPLPTALGDADPDLVRLFGPVPELTRIWRILTTPALRRTPRVSAFFEFITSRTHELRPILTG